jgi:hypothetical protein
MDSKELMHVIALLLEDSKRLQELEPNAGTEARIWLAKERWNPVIMKIMIVSTYPIQTPNFCATQ